VAVNTHNRHLFLGSLGLLHCHRIVYPLTFGSPEGMDDWTLADWCDQCHRKKGMVVWTHPYELSADFNYGEPLADLVLGRIDAYEVSYSDAPRHMEDYYDLCRAGLIVPLVGASAKGDNCAVLGAMRTYASIDNSDDLGYENWLRAIRAGRSFATNGPLLSLKINGSVPTATLDIAEAVENVHVHIEAISLVPFQSVELLWNGHVVASSMAALELPCKANLDYDLPTNRSGWLAVRCRGTALLPNSRQDNVREVFAHTTAIAVRKEGSPFVAEATVIDRFLEELDSMLDWTENKALCSTQRDRDRLRYIFEEARTVLAKKLS
jgi:hypothetical protein